jgi:hypothetical protein
VKLPSLLPLACFLFLPCKHKNRATKMYENKMSQPNLRGVRKEISSKVGKTKQPTTIHRLVSIFVSNLENYQK